MGTDGEALATGTVETWVGSVRVTASERGVREIMLPRWDETRTPFAATAARATVVSSDAHAAEAHLRATLDELAEFFTGRRRQFTAPLDPRGPAFFARAWAEVARVPYGETRTYGEIARQLGAPAATRAVGAANGANPLAPLVPCHRVLGSDGRLTGYGPGLPMKQALLELEDAVPASPEDYDAWVDRVSARLRAEGLVTWYLGIRKLGVYCRPNCDRGGAHRLAPNRLLRSRDEAAAAGFQPCPVCRPDADDLPTPARLMLAAGRG